MLKQFGAFLKAKDETISALQQQIMTFENNRLTREAIRNYEDLDSTSILMVSAMCSAPLSSCTSVIFRTNSTSRSSASIPPNRRTCPERSQWLPGFVKLCGTRYLLVTSATTMSPPLFESCLPETICITRKSRRRKTTPSPSYTRTLLRYSRCFSILPFRLFSHLRTLSLLRHFFPSAGALLPTRVRFYSNFLANMSCSLVEISSRRPQIYWSLIRLALASLRRLNPRQLQLLSASTMISTHINVVRPNTSFNRGKGNGKINRKGARKVAGRGDS